MRAGVHVQPGSNPGTGCQKASGELSHPLVIALRGMIRGWMRSAPDAGRTTSTLMVVGSNPNRRSSGGSSVDRAARDVLPTLAGACNREADAQEQDASEDKRRSRE